MLKVDWWFIRHDDLLAGVEEFVVAEVFADSKDEHFVPSELTTTSERICFTPVIGSVSINLIDGPRGAADIAQEVQ